MCSSDLSIEKTRRIEEINRQIASDRLRNEQQTKEYYVSRIKNHEMNIRTWEGYLEFSMHDEKETRRWQGAIRLAKANISSLAKERDERLGLINENSQLNIEEKLISLNLITII